MFHFNTALEGDSAANDMGRCGSEAHEHSAASEGREERGSSAGWWWWWRDVGKIQTLFSAGR